MWIGAHLCATHDTVGGRPLQQINWEEPAYPQGGPLCLAIGQLSDANTRALGKKEVLVSLINGLLWALVVGSICGYWFDNWLLAGIIAFAIIINMLVAALSGIIIPLLLSKAGIDPALAGAVILTTVTDVVGFFVFLGMATFILL